MLRSFLFLEMTIPKSEYEKEIVNQRYIIYEHLFYLIMFPDSIKNHNVWKQHLTTPLLNLNGLTVKGTKTGKLSKEKYFKFLFEEYFCGDQIEINEKGILNLARDVLQLKSNISSPFRSKSLQYMGYDDKFPIKTIYKKLKSFFIKISELLSTSDIARDRVYKLVDDIILN